MVSAHVLCHHKYPKAVILFRFCTLPFCAIKLLPLAGSPTITTHIRVSSTWTPTPLVFAFEVPLVRVEGRMNSAGGVFMRFGRYCSTASLGGDEGLVAEGMLEDVPMNRKRAVQRMPVETGEQTKVVKKQKMASRLWLSRIEPPNSSPGKR